MPTTTEIVGDAAFAMSGGVIDSLVGDMVALAESGDPHARQMLAKAARRGIQQAQQVCHRLGIEWKR